MPAYLVVIDESEEARAALRFAARRAARTGSKVEIVALIPPPDFVHAERQVAVKRNGAPREVKVGVDDETRHGILWNFELRRPRPPASRPGFRTLDVGC